jgi:hypothetical protein
MTPLTTSFGLVFWRQVRKGPAGDWLNALPLSSIGLKMYNATIRIVTGLYVLVCLSSALMSVYAG